MAEKNVQEPGSKGNISALDALDLLGTCQRKMAFLDWVIPSLAEPGCPTDEILGGLASIVAGINEDLSRAEAAITDEMRRKRAGGRDAA